jgi:hypothetical protein
MYWQLSSAKDDGQGCLYSICNHSSGGAPTHFSVRETIFKDKQNLTVSSVLLDESLFQRIPALN